MSKKFRVQREREFKPHHILIGTATMALESAETRTPGWTYYELTAITFSALALEAITNSFGERLIPRWCDFESSSPIAKLRVICARLGMDPDFEREPWNVAAWLMKFRNKVAHARPESIRYDRTLSEKELAKIRFEFPSSKMEMEISLQNAKRAVAAIDQILELFYPKLNRDDRIHLYHDGFTGGITAC